MKWDTALESKEPESNHSRNQTKPQPTLLLGPDIVFIRPWGGWKESAFSVLERPTECSLALKKQWTVDIIYLLSMTPESELNPGRYSQVKPSCTEKGKSSPLPFVNFLFLSLGNSKVTVPAIGFFAEAAPSSVLLTQWDHRRGPVCAFRRNIKSREFHT